MPRLTPATPKRLASEELRRRRIAQARAIRGDGFLFSGNRQQCVPSALLLDRRLTPLERNAWQVFRLLMSDGGLTAFPTYEELRRYLATSPGALASPETVARVLTVLRLTRWLSLVRRRRDPKTGRPMGNVYVLHDSPLTPYEAMALDPNYLELLGEASTRNSKSLATVVHIVMEEIANDPALQARGVPTRLEVLQQQIAERDAEPSYPQAEQTVDARESLRFLSTDSVVVPKLAPDKGLRFEEDDSTVRSIRNIKIRTTVKPPESVEASKTEPSSASDSFMSVPLHIPEAFRRLREEQRQAAHAAMAHLTHERQQAVLDEWAARCRTDAIRKPVGYLFGIIQKAIRGEFNPTRTHSTAAVPVSKPSSPPPVIPVATPERARFHLEQINKLIREHKHV
jgi:hypothetical protein